MDEVKQRSEEVLASIRETRRASSEVLQKTDDMEKRLAKLLKGYCFDVPLDVEQEEETPPPESPASSKSSQIDSKGSLFQTAKKFTGMGKVKKSGSADDNKKKPKRFS